MTKPWLLWQLATHPKFVGGKISTLDTRVYKIFEAFQSLEDQVFRLDENMSASAYKHSTAHVLHELGIIASPEPHPACKDRRGPDEAQRMIEALRRPKRLADRLGIPLSTHGDR